MKTEFDSCYGYYNNCLFFLDGLFVPSRWILQELVKGQYPNIYKTAAIEGLFRVGVGISS